ncbi:MAG: tetratricopeptide repeat protein [Pseudomonadota bacterium]
MKPSGIQIKDTGFDPSHINRLINRGHFEAAEKLLKKAEKKKTKGYDVSFLKGKLAVSQYQIDKAEHLFKLALKQAKNEEQKGQATFQLSTIAFHKKDYAKTRQLIESFKKDNWGSDKHTLQYLKVLRDTRDEERFNSLLPKLKPHCRNIKTLLLCGECLIQTDQIDKAKSFLDAFLYDCDDIIRASILRISLDVATADFEAALDFIGSLPEAVQNDPMIYRDWVKLRHYLDPDTDWINQLRAFRGTKNLPYIKWTESSLCLSHGLFDEGFELFESRYEADGKDRYVRYLPTRFLLTQGLPTNGHKTLVSFEQGVGDQVRFSRFFHGLSEGEEKAIQVVAEERLTPLLKRSFPNIHFFDSVKLETNQLKKQNIKDEVMMGSGGVFPSHRPFHAKMKSPYLVPDQELVTQLGSKRDPARLTVGVFWRSVQVLHTRNLWYPDLKDFSRIFEGLHCELVSLQNSVSEQEKTVFKESGGELEITDIDCKDDLDSLSALCSSVDVVVGVGTATAELSGAVGQKTLIVANRHPNRWYLNQTYMDAFYPDMHMFLSDTGTPWTDSLEAVRAELEKLAAEKSAKS